MNRVACFWTPHFAAQVERQRLGSETRPLLVCDGETVLDPCYQAAARGVRAKDSLSRALTHCPNARMVQADRAHYQKVWEQIAVVLEQHSPAIETDRLGLAYLDAKDMAALYGSEAEWCLTIRQDIQNAIHLEARLGVAPSRFAAWVAVKSLQSAQGYQLVSQEACAYLEALSVNWLPLSEEARRRLHMLGFHTIGQFANLKPASVAEQFDPESLRAHRLARGKDADPPQGQRRRTSEAHVEFEVPETREEALLTAIMNALGKSWEEKSRHVLAVQRIEIKIRLFEGAAWEHSAWIGKTLGPKKLRHVLEQLLSKLLDERAGSGLGVSEIYLALVGLEPAVGDQLNLFAHAESRLCLEETLRKLARKHSPQCVTQAQVRSALAPMVKDQFALEAYRL